MKRLSTLLQCLPLLALWVALASADDLFNDLNCHYEELPTTLNSISYLGFNGEFHMHGEYFDSFSANEKIITFQLTQQSAFRAYTAPHEADIDLWLYNATSGTSLKHSSLAVGTDEVIQATLPPGSYRLHLTFFGVWLGQYHAQDCDTLILDVQVVPTAVVSQRAAALSCPANEIFPVIHFGPLASGQPVTYRSDFDDAGTVMNVRGPSSPRQSDIRWVYGYNFTIPSGGDNSLLWKLEAGLGTEFIFGGSLAMMLQRSSSGAPSLACVRQGNCTKSTINDINEHVLKAILTPGDYTLWVLDHIGEKNAAQVSCIPFSFRIDVSTQLLKENFITCQAPRLPTSLLPNQFDQPSGVVHYRESALIELDKPSSTITFSVQTDSFFRIAVSPHRVDIDLKLFDGSGRQLEYSGRWGGEDSIATVVTPGSYNISVIYFGINEPRFCETFDVEIAIAPVSLYPAGFPYCSVAASAPDLGAMATAISSAGNFTYTASGSYVNQFGGNFAGRPIVSQNFTLSQSVAFVAEIGYDFLLGDMEVFLINLDTSTNFYADHRRNFGYLSATLERGNYTLVVATGTTQKNNIPGFPGCSEYTLKITVKPRSQAGPCWGYLRLPRSLNTPQYLGHTGVTHFIEQYVAPLPPGAFSVTEKLFFDIAVESMFRVWTERNPIDVDFYLYENGTYKAKSDSFNNEEEISWHLLPGKRYELDVIYYHFASSDPHTVEPDCFLYSLELSIAPISPNGQPCVNYLPPTDFIPTYSSGNDTFYFEGRFLLNQTLARSFVASYPFTINDDFVLFRAMIRYDFLYSDLSLRLVVNNQSTIWGTGEYDANDVETILLSPGLYILQIYEPARTNVPEYRRCVPFDLIVSYQPSSGGEMDSLLGCSASPFPPSLNTNSYLSALSGNRMHFERPVLVNVGSRSDGFEFTVAETSFFRLFVPRHPVIDVDFHLRSGTKAQPGPQIVSNTGTVEESILVKLTPGPYWMYVRYYGYMGGRLPSASDCVTFPIEITITPVSYLESSAALTIPCSTQQVPSQMQFNTPFYGEYSRSMADGNFSQTLTMTLNYPAVLEFDLRYHFPSGPVYVSLLGSVSQGQTVAVNRTFWAEIAYNHAFFHKVLPRGTYSLVIHDPFSPMNVDPILKCSHFSLSYIVNTNSTGEIDRCDYISTPFPADLYTAAGGSQPYGGPQDPIDGSVRIFGDSFTLTTTPRDNFLLFKINVPSYVRAFAKAPQGNDIDFFFYNNASRPPGSLVPGGSSVGTDVAESKLLRLNPQANPYLLDVYVFRMARPADDECPVFYFEMAIKPETVVQQELACPNQLPTPEVPPAFIDLSQSVWQYNEDLYFTKSRIDANTNNRTRLFTYRITLQVSFNTTLFASVGFDFLVNDFRLVLRDASNPTGAVARGDSSGAQSRDDAYNFFNLLYVELTPGTYYLDIIEDVRGKNLGVVEYCHRFSFFLAAFVDGNPTIDYVNPPSGEDLDPTQDLVVTIAFSESVVLPDAAADLVTYLRSQNIISLVPTDDESNPIYAAAATFDGTRRILEVSFGHSRFSIGKSYRLNIDASKFQDGQGRPFTLPTDSTFVYRMNRCECSGHGTCDQTGGRISCRCNTGYTGDRCQLCAQGYFWRGSECSPVIPCTQYFCNGHGRCDNSAGYPVCFCDPGYATSGNDFCKTCAAGYVGYPNCTAISPDIARSNRCNAPILPDSLDSIGFLGFNGEVHLRNEYYIDTDNLRHDTYFSLSQDSVFRSYTEPHWIDVDMYLYRLKEDGSIDETVDRGIAIGVEEALFAVIRGSAEKPVKYLLRFRYYIWDRRHPINCETFNFEMAIMPAARVLSEAGQMASQCAPTNSLPSPPPIAPNAEYNYAPAQDFTLRSSATAVKNQPNYFWSWSFTIQTPPSKAAVLFAEVGYRFLVGDLALVLETESAEAPHCGANGGLEDECIAGSNVLNRNQINELLEDGNYTLWIYEPEPQNFNLTACSLFNLKISVKYVDLAQDFFYCDARAFPKSLNVPGFFDSRGYVHIQETFLLSDPQTVFTVTQSSSMRVSANSAFSMAWELVNNVTGTILQSSWYSKNPQLFAQLNPGTYRLRAKTFAVSLGSCPQINVELKVSPNSLLPNSCPGREQLPDIPAITSVPFKFPTTSSPDGPTSYFAYTNNAVIKQVTFTLDQVSIVEAVLDSDFLTGGLRVIVQFNDRSSRVLYGRDNYHQNYLREMLDPGSYTLKIARPDAASNPPTTFPPCTEFNFQMSIVLASAADPCAGDGEPIPTTFNSVRYLGADGQFDFGSSSFRIPTFNFFTSTLIPFSVTNTSVIRVYTQPHVVDIDCVLYLAGDDSRALASGNFTFNEQESFVYELQPNTDYVLKLLFWKWDPSSVPQCPMFNMEVSILPSRLAALPDKVCPGSVVTHWPPAPPSTQSLPSTPYSYNSVAAGETLFYQQNIFRTRSPPIQFTLRDTANLHAELGYDFPTGDLLMRLSNDNSTEVYWGVNELNGNVLNVVGLSAGDYTLIISEVTSNLADYLGCSKFTFQLLIQPDSKDVLDPQYPPLPTNLDAIPFLKYDGRVHLEETYTVFSNSTREDVAFTVAKESLMRVSTSHSASQLNSVQLVVLDQSGNTFATFYETMLELLPVGRYVLRFNRPVGATGTLFLEVQLAIAPSEVLIADIAAYRPPQPPTCADRGFDPIVLNPQGAFLFGDESLTISQQTQKNQVTLQTVPFTLTNDSVLYAKVAYHFLLSDLELSVTGTKAENQEQVVVYGRNSKNLNDIDIVLPAGSYNLVLSQEVKFAFPGSDRFAHCTIFAGRLVIQDVNREKGHVDCSALDLLPWDLNSPTGGSQYFGGPMQSGSLHMVGESFLMPVIRGQVDVMALNVTATSLMSVITKQRYYSDINYLVSRGASSIAPQVRVNDYSQRAELFVLQDGGAFSLALRYNTPARISCPYFGLQVSVKPISLVSQSLACPQQITDRLPQKEVTLQARGVYSEYLDSYFTNAVLTQTGNSTRFLYEIKLVIANNSRIVASLGFNTLANMFQMRLQSQGSSPSSRYEIGRGSLILQDAGTGNTNVNLLLSSTLTPGTYYIQLIQPKFQLPFLSQIGTTRCYPFVWNLQIVPDTDLPYIPSVAPPSGSSLSPQNPLALDITFSVAIYAGGRQVTTSAPLLRALYLYPTDDQNTRIFPRSAAPEATSSSTWHVVFPANFAPKKTYKLGLVAGVLTDQAGSAVQLVSTNLYSMIDITCNGKGTFDRGYCFCQMGYAGEECTTCDVGYKNTDTQGGLNCQRSTGNLCLETSCGCQKNTQPCIPLGTCDDSSGKIVCTCTGHYAGPTCNQCAPGYTDWDSGCVPVAQCPACVNGNCDQATKTCICNAHWAGKTCAECASGWTGTNCAIAVNAPKGGNQAKPSAALKAITVLSIIVALGVILGTVGFLVFRKFFKPRRYAQLDLSELTELEDN